MLFYLHDMSCQFMGHRCPPDKTPVQTTKVIRRIVYIVQNYMSKAQFLEKHYLLLLLWWQGCTQFQNEIAYMQGDWYENGRHSIMHLWV